MSDAYNRKHALGCITNEMLSGDNPQTVVEIWVACSKKGAKKSGSPYASSKARWGCKTTQQARHDA
jgi:hypothetical protein